MRRMVRTGFIVVITMALFSAGCRDSPTPDPTTADVRYEGKTVDEWLQALEIEHDPNSRRMVLNALGRMHSDDARVVPAIARFLGDRDPRVRGTASSMLVTYGARGLAAATEKLRDGTREERESSVRALAAATGVNWDVGGAGLVIALGVPDHVIRMQAVDALVARGDESIEPLRGAALEGPAEMRRDALTGLVRLRDDTTIIALLSDDDLADAAEAALQERGEAARGACESALARPGASARVKSLVQRLNRLRAEKLVAQIPTRGDAAVDEAIALGAASVDAFVGLVGHPDEDVRASAIAALVTLDHLAEQAVATALLDEDLRVVSAAVQVLLASPRQSAQDHLVAALGTDSPETRTRLWDALSGAGKPGRAVVLAALNGENAASRAGAIDVLLRLTTDGLDLLCERLTSTGRDARHQFVDAFIALERPGLLGLVEALGNDDPSIVKKATEALRAAGTSVADPLLARGARQARGVWTGEAIAIELLLSMDKKLGDDRVLAAVLSGHGRTQQFARSVLARRGAEAVRSLSFRLDDLDAEECKGAADALLSFGPDNTEAVAVLIGRLRDDVADVRYAAVRCAMGLGDDLQKHEDALRQLLQDDDDRVSVVAATALLKLRKGSRAVLDVIRKAQVHASPAVRVAAFEARYRSALPNERFGVVLSALDQQEPVELRRRAVHLLESGPLVPPQVPHLLLAMRDEDEEVSTRARELYSTLTVEPWASLAPDRSRAQRLSAIRDGSEETHAAQKQRVAAVDRALGWFAAHQSKDGRWSAADFHKLCVSASAPADKSKACTGPGEAAYDIGVTGLALLCFLANGETPTSGPHADVVKRGVEFLMKQQDAEGCIGRRTSMHFQFNHGYASLALVEAYGLTHAEALREPAQRALDFVLQSQNPRLAWRYGVRDGDNDTATTAVMVAVLRAGHDAGLFVEATAFRGARAWIDKMTEPDFGRVGYQQRGGQPARPK